MIWLWTIPALALLLSLALLTLGVRGRRVDDHPICRQCGFDLFGRPQGSVVCSECGGDLSARRAIRSGRRVRRGGMIAIGVLMLAIALSLGGGAGYATYAIKDWQPYKPVWWLVREIDHGDTKTQSAAITEVMGRLANGKLSDPQVMAIADTMLTLQGDPNKPWQVGCGDFIERARFARRLSDERWQRYGRQALQLTLDVRPWVRRGDPIAFQLRYLTPTRAGSSSAVALTTAPASIFIGGQRFNAPNWRPGTQLVPMSLPGGIYAGTYDARLRDGPQEVRVVADLMFGNSSLAMSRVATVEMDGQFKLFAEYESTVRVSYDETVTAQMVKSVRTSAASLVQTPSGSQWEITVECKSPPVGVGYVLTLSDSGGGTETPLGMIACPPNQSRTFQLRCPVHAGGGALLRLKYYPAPPAAAASTDTFEIWAGAIPTRTVSIVSSAPIATPSARPLRWSTTRPVTPPQK